MKKLYTSVKLIGLTMAIGFTNNANAQITIDFESANLPIDSMWNGSDLSGFYSESGVKFENSYNTSFMSWDGFSVSTMRDDTTAGYTNEFGSISGNGYNSNTFGVYYPGFGATNFIEFESIVEFTSMYVNNSTYAALSMQNGDGFAKQFGSVNGADGNPDGTNGEDWFMLRIYSVDGFNNRLDSLDFYLADFRFPAAQNDYIITEWTQVDLSSLTPGNKLEFQLSSSDVGGFGMNTPAYFDFDDLMFDPTLSIQENQDIAFTVYPNPAQNQFRVEGVEYDQLRIVDLSGKVVKTLFGSTELVDVSGLNQGLYFLNVFSKGKQIGQQKLIKE